MFVRVHEQYGFGEGPCLLIDHGEEAREARSGAGALGVG
jgi:hypothetical protein